jgi:DNA-binding NtrC family response regulator
MIPQMEKILIVDSDPNLCKFLYERLCEIGYPTTYVTTGYEAFKILSDNSIDLLLLNLNLPDETSFNILRYINFKNMKTKIVAITTYNDTECALRAYRMGALDFIWKPLDFDDLLISIRKALQL